VHSKRDSKSACASVCVCVCARRVCEVIHDLFNLSPAGAHEIASTTKDYAAILCMHNEMGNDAFLVEYSNNSTCRLYEPRSLVSRSADRSAENIESSPKMKYASAKKCRRVATMSLRFSIERCNHDAATAHNRCTMSTLEHLTPIKIGINSIYFLYDHPAELQTVC